MIISTTALKERNNFSPKDKWFVYIVECSDKSLYTGITNDLAKRISCHNSGKGAKYTRARRPVSLKYYETLDNKSSALKREIAIKQLTRNQKMKMIVGSYCLCQ